MPPKISEKQIKAVMGLPPSQRYQHFLKQVADWEEAWGLYNCGWALSETHDGKQVFPLWPAKEYAIACASGYWSKYEPKSIELDYLMEELLPRLQVDDVLPGVFFTLEQGSVEISAEQLQHDLHLELENYH